MRWAGHVARIDEERGYIGSCWGNRRDLQEVGCGYMDWIGLAQGGDRWLTLVSVVMNLQVP
jgi:hypothetical protein